MELSEGFVLVGGGSRRFGSTKTTTAWRGRPLAEHALRALVGLGVRTRLVTADPMPYLQWGVPLVTTEPPGRGPVGALAAALRVAQAGYVLVLAGDMPRVDTALLRRLVAAGEGVDAVCCTDPDGRRHPFPGLYATRLDPDPDRDGSMQALLDRVGARTVSGPADALVNVNHPEDLAGLG